MNRSDAIAGGLFGLLVGDALGVPYEFSPPDLIPRFDLIEMSSPDGFRRAHVGTPAGTWSDDGAQALCLLASLLHCGGLDLGDFGTRMVNWLDLGYRAVEGRVFDVGGTSSRSIARLRNGVPAALAGGMRERDNGNGALMRVLPLALWHRGTDAALVRDARLSSLPTHGHLRSQLCCALYCLWARFLLQQSPSAWDEAVEVLRQLHPSGTSERHELDAQILAFPRSRCGGGGYVVDCLHSVRIALEQRSYESVVRAAIAFGNDTDTTACVAGGLAGMRWGVSGIPDRWMASLHGRSAIADDIAALAAARGIC